MFQSISTLTRLLIVGACLTAATSARAQSMPSSEPLSVYCDGSVSASDCDMIKRVARKLVAVITLEHDLHTWPPDFFVHDQKNKNGQSVLNAFAHPCYEPTDRGMPHQCGTDENRTDPHVHVTTRLLNELVQGREDRLAFVLGHELAHITLGHTTPFAFKWRATSDLSLMAFSRQQEIGSDWNGVQYGLAAGYPFDGMMNAFYRFIELGLTYSSFEGLGLKHPSWEDRLLMVNEDKSPLWRSMSTFKNGVAFLITEQYKLAEECFRDVIASFPNSYEAHANLGYALLMQYADALGTEDVERFGIGHIVIGAFTRRPRSLQPPVRGIDRVLWFQAVSELTEALRLNPSLVEAKANLGIAYMINPSGPDTDRARQLLDEAASAALVSQTMDNRAKAAVLINAGVAELAAGYLQASMEQLSDAEQQIRSRGESFLASGEAVHGELIGAFYYNAGLLMEKVQSAEARKAAFENFGSYLEETSPTSAWWPIAYRKYESVARAAGLTPKSRSSFEYSHVRRYRPVSGVTIKDGLTVVLGQPTIQFLEDVDKVHDNQGALWVVSTKLIEQTNLTEYDMYLDGVKVIATQEVLSIVLSAGSPAIEIRDVGLGTESRTIQAGMSQSSLESILGSDYEMRVLVDQNKRYRFYRDSGIAVSVNNGTVDEIVITQIPVRHVLDPEDE